MPWAWYQSCATTLRSRRRRSFNVCVSTLPRHSDSQHTLDSHSEKTMDRRTFLETSALAASGVAFTRIPDLASSDANSLPLRADPPMIGIQSGAVSFVDEGTSAVLDN